MVSVHAMCSGDNTRITLDVLVQVLRRLLWVNFEFLGKHLTLFYLVK